MAVSTKPTMEVLLRLVVEQGATDLHLSANLPPHLRLDDRLLPADYPPLSGNEVKELAYSLISPDKVERFERWKDRKSTRLNSSHGTLSRMPSSA